ncbi:MAG: ABC transporter ATP-binding protein [Gammaproteobacteria bacterium]|nr:ABC transporter ATP-binding protein [Gammaproteobacteria bacterium]
MKALSIRDLRKVYSDGTEAVKGIDLDVEEGDFFALLGPNGAGKTTTIGIITSLVNKTGGKVSVFEHDIDEDFAAAKACIGLVPQEINFNMFETCFQIVCNQAGYYGIPRQLAEERAEKYLKELDLWGKRDQSSRNLSGGMKRRLMIARALVHEPRLLILDEPTAGVDIEIRRSMWSFLRKINAEGTTIILTTHYLEEAENLCRNIAIINHGRIAENTRMKSLLEKLHVETFIFDLREPVKQDVKLDGYDVTTVDDTTIEVEITKEQDINDLFKRMSESGLQVLSMRNKVNRLEELFVRMTEKGNAA